MSRHHRRRGDEPTDTFGREATDDRSARERLLARLSETLIEHDVPGSVPGDAIDELCHAVAMALPRLRAEHGDFWAFAFAVGSRARSGGLPGDGRTREDRMAAILEELPEDQRSVLLLRLQGRLSVPATARLLGSTPATVRVVQHRALRTLDEAWSRLGPPPADGDVHSGGVAGQRE